MPSSMLAPFSKGFNIKVSGCELQVSSGVIFDGTLNWYLEERVLDFSDFASKVIPFRLGVYARMDSPNLPATIAFTQEGGIRPSCPLYHLFIVVVGTQGILAVRKTTPDGAPIWDKGALIYHKSSEENPQMAANPPITCSPICFNPPVEGLHASVDGSWVKITAGTFDDGNKFWGVDPVTLDFSVFFESPWFKGQFKEVFVVLVPLSGKSPQLIIDHTIRRQENHYYLYKVILGDRRIIEVVKVQADGRDVENPQMTAQTPVKDSTTARIKNRVEDFIESIKETSVYDYRALVSPNTQPEGGHAVIATREKIANSLRKSHDLESWGITVPTCACGQDAPYLAVYYEKAEALVCGDCLGKIPSQELMAAYSPNSTLDPSKKWQELSPEMLARLAPPARGSLGGKCSLLTCDGLATWVRHDGDHHLCEACALERNGWSFLYPYGVDKGKLYTAVK